MIGTKDYEGTILLPTREHFGLFHYPACVQSHYWVALTWRDGLELAGDRKLLVPDRGGVVLAEGGGPVCSGNQVRLL